LAAFEGVKRMTGVDLIVAAPWIIFAVVLATICIFLLRARHAPRRDHPEPAQDPNQDPYPDPGSRMEEEG
jgi:hypothetical protein